MSEPGPRRVQLQALLSEQLLKAWAMKKNADLSYLAIRGKNLRMITALLHEWVRRGSDSSAAM